MKTKTQQPFARLVLGSLGVVFGDIGTSPLYTLRLALGSVSDRPDTAAVIGVLSLMVWALITVVTIKYVMIVMRIDNKGEGGILALLAVARRAQEIIPRQRQLVITIGLAGTALFFADAIITPAISVLSAVEGLHVATDTFDAFVIPIAAAILIALFLFQRRGTEGVGRLFGPIIAVWFVVLAALGVYGIASNPGVLWALSPVPGVLFLISNPVVSFFTLGFIVLTVTGGEALYADMGHFGRGPIRVAWILFVMPALVLNYLGQGAHELTTPETNSTPFYLLAQDWAVYPLVLLATAATVIASQAVISGAYSLAQQAVQLNYWPRLQIIHTSEIARGQIYVPRVNWAMLAGVLFLVAAFHNSDALASAYGLSVTGTMLATTVLVFFARGGRRGAIPFQVFALFLPFFLIDLGFFAATMTKLFDGGILPLALGGGLFLAMTSWAQGRKILAKVTSQHRVSPEAFIQSLDERPKPRTPGVAIFLSSEADSIPHALLHNLKHNRSLHERIVILRFEGEDVPHVRYDQRLTIEDLGAGFTRLTVRHGFMDDPNVPQVLRLAAAQGLQLGDAPVSYFFGNRKFVASARSALSRWRQALFIALSQTAENPADFFGVPVNQSVELGTQIEI